MIVIFWRKVFYLWNSVTLNLAFRKEVWAISLRDKSSFYYLRLLLLEFVVFLLLINHLLNTNVTSWYWPLTSYNSSESTSSWNWRASRASLNFWCLSTISFYYAGINKWYILPLSKLVVTMSCFPELKDLIELFWFWLRFDLDCSLTIALSLLALCIPF